MSDVLLGGLRVRPNLLAAVSVVLGALGIMTLSIFWVTGPLTTLLGLLGLLFAWLARKQALDTGYGSTYARWGTVLGLINLVIGLVSSAFVAWILVT